MKRRIGLGVTAVGLVLLLVAQFLPAEYGRTNPPATATIEGPPEVVEVLRRACFDCHSYETEWPLYSRVAPISWMIGADVAGGRSRLNFSEWETLRAGHRRRFVRKIVDRIEAGEMPMPRYLLLHRDARVSDEEIAVLRAWRDRVDPPEEAR